MTPSDSLASGLPIYVPGSGVRDARAWTMALLHLSLQWHLGAGAMYLRIMGDAADSPIVSDEGSKNQWIYGWSPFTPDRDAPRRWGCPLAASRHFDGCLAGG